MSKERVKEKRGDAREGNDERFAQSLMARRASRKTSTLGTRCKMLSVTRDPVEKREKSQDSRGRVREESKATNRSNSSVQARPFPSRWYRPKDRGRRVPESKIDVSFVL